MAIVDGFHYWLLNKPRVGNEGKNKGLTRIKTG